MEAQHIGICGSGIMGSGILEVFATAGHSVTLCSRSTHSAIASKEQVSGRLQRSVAKERITAEQADAVLARITVTDDLHAFHDMDFVVESVLEDLIIKRELFERLDDICQPITILLTNTSTLPIVEIAMATERPNQVCGLHFFNPAPMMDAVEIVNPITASQETVEAAVQLAESCNKLPVIVKDEAGFIVNNLLFPYLNRAVSLLERGGYEAGDIDQLMKGGCGFPMGPLELLDLVGLDTSLAILDALHEEFNDQSCSADPRLRRMVSAGQLGRKSGKGFYDYS